MLTVFAGCIMMNIGINVGFTAAAVPIKEAFKLDSAFLINMNALAFPIMTIPMTFVAI